MNYLGNRSLVFFHQLIHIFLLLLHTTLQVILFSLQPTDLLLQLTGQSEGGSAFKCEVRRHFHYLLTKGLWLEKLCQY